MKLSKSLLILSMLIVPQFVLAEVVEVFDCKGENKLAVAKTETGATANIVINVTKETAPGVVATLKGIDRDITRTTVASSGMLKFDNIQSGKYKLCSAGGVLAFNSINISGAGVAVTGAGAMGGIGGAGGAGTAGAVGAAGAVGTGATLGTVAATVGGAGALGAAAAVGTKEGGNNQDQFTIDENGNKKPAIKPGGSAPVPDGTDVGSSETVDSGNS